MRGMRYARIGLLVAGCLGLVSCLGPPLVILPTVLPNAVEGRRYEENLNTSENRAVQWEVAGGALPQGLALDSQSGVISGAPRLPDTYAFTVTVSESLPHRTGSRDYSITVLPQLLVEFAPTPARVGEAYEYTPLIEGGVPPYTVTVTHLPGGIFYDTTTGTISGTPDTEYSDWRMEVDVIDSGDPQQADSGRGTFVVHPVGVSITTEELPNAAVGVEYKDAQLETVQLKAEHGLAPYRWAFSAGNPPDGLRLNNLSGEITGTPRTSATTETFTVLVTDSDHPASSDSREFKLVVPVIITTDELPKASVEVDYETSVGAAAGLEPYTWEITVGALPNGLRLDKTNGVISGTPTPFAAGQTFPFTIRVTDSDTPATFAEQELSILVP